jgi:hypothetical protein
MEKLLKSINLMNAFPVVCVHWDSRNAKWSSLKYLEEAEKLGVKDHR